MSPETAKAADSTNEQICTQSIVPTPRGHVPALPWLFRLSWCVLAYGLMIVSVMTGKYCTGKSSVSNLSNFVEFGRNYLYHTLFVMQMQEWLQINCGGLRTNRLRHFCVSFRSISSAFPSAMKNFPQNAVVAAHGLWYNNSSERKQFAEGSNARYNTCQRRKRE